jgi:hypothetical protein
MIPNVSQGKIPNHILATHEHVPTVVDDHSFLRFKTGIHSMLVCQRHHIKPWAEMGGYMSTPRPMKIRFLEQGSDGLLSTALYWFIHVQGHLQLIEGSVYGPGQGFRDEIAVGAYENEGETEALGQASQGSYSMIL